MAADKLNVITPYIALAATGNPAAYRVRGFLRWYLLWDVLVTCALKLAFIHFQHWDEHAHRMVWPLYYPLWRIAEPIRVALAAAVVLTRCRPRMWPVLPALALHVWAGGFANVWPGSWLQAEEHAIGFCCMALGLILAASPRRTDADRATVVILAALFFGTGAAYYPTPWEPAIRHWLMWVQSACYLALWATSKK